ncbi:DUF805 domain-containing protein [Hyphomonas johnsonii]|jgi:uncharacterized membrane protein YhaH (DUF805 family)|uniref:Transmembrane protein n=1 Tax=Hyphomonas johnsonii MHS-2 TaxID=1280950 RepID=A0A059FDZ3_9PROT|nr:DUF805 domain-containing protein [Hyphomonas johnsonii]KCZ88839.1 hypothetical protein HJO_15019 [Hyphomonas johnsonii MHS-2]
MDIKTVLFNPNGRIGPREFGQGLILLTGAMMIIQILLALVSPAFGVLQWAIVFSYVCVFGKRLHDAGQSAWLYLAFLVGYFVVSTVFSALLMPILSPDALAMRGDFEKLAEAGDFAAAFEEIAKNAAELARESVVTTLVSFLLASGTLGLIAGRLPSDPSTNRYGPPPNGPDQANTYS